MSQPRQTAVSEALRRAVRASGLSPYAVARAAGVPQPVLWRFLRGQSGLTLRNAGKLAAFLGLELRPAAGGRGRRHEKKPPVV